jgi:hypothetical protein
VVPDPRLIAALRQQLARLTMWRVCTSALAAHPPLIAAGSWHGPAAQAHARAAVEVRQRIHTADEAVAAAIAATTAELRRAEGAAADG